MIAAFLAVGFFTSSILTSARAARHLGGISANMVRLAMALPLLMIFAALAGHSPWASHRAGDAWFLWSGVLGMGVCDIFVLSAYARLGPRVTSLIVNAFAAPAAAVISWCLLGELPGFRQLAAIAAIMMGVLLVLRPRSGDRFDGIGIVCGLIGAASFSCASVMSKMGFEQAAAAGDPIHWLDSAVVRVAAGLVLSFIIFVLVAPFARAWRDGPGRWRQAFPWLLINACLGPCAGMVCYQWALTTTSAAEVHAMVAVIPVLVLVATWAWGGERPDVLSVFGTVFAGAGVAALAFMHA